MLAFARHLLEVSGREVEFTQGLRGTASQIRLKLLQDMGKYIYTIDANRLTLHISFHFTYLLQICALNCTN